MLARSLALVLSLHIPFLTIARGANPSSSSSRGKYWGIVWRSPCVELENGKKESLIEGKMKVTKRHQCTLFRFARSKEERKKEKEDKLSRLSLPPSLTSMAAFPPDLPQLLAEVEDYASTVG